MTDTSALAPKPGLANLPTLADIPQLADGVACDILVAEAPVGLEDELLSSRRAGFSLASITMAGDDEATPAQIYRVLARMRHRVSLHSDTMVLVDSVGDIKAAKAAGKLGVNFNFQGTEPVGRDVANIGAYYKLGVRQMLMAYNFQNNVGTGCIEGETNDTGLSAFGREVVAEMNRVGMIVDCSHSGYRTTMDTMAASTAPCIFSHSNPRALSDHPRNIRDDQIKACAATGGIVGINGVGYFMGEKGEVPVAAMVRQIDYVADLVGPEHIALGLDYMTPLHCKLTADFYKGDTMPKVGLGALPWHFFSPTLMPQLLQALLAKGYPVDAVRGIMGENFLRVASAVWK